MNRRDVLRLFAAIPFFKLWTSEGAEMATKDDILNQFGIVAGALQQNQRDFTNVSPAPTQAMMDADANALLAAVNQLKADYDSYNFGGALSVTNPPAQPTTLTQGQPYSLQLQASGGTGPYHWHISGGGFPANMTLSDSGLLAGNIIAASGSQFSGVITLVDSATPTPANIQFSFWFKIA